jgi:hypothetical protein
LKVAAEGESNHAWQKPDRMMRRRIYIKDAKGALMRLPQKFFAGHGEFSGAVRQTISEKTFSVLCLPQEFFGGYGYKFALPELAGTVQKVITVYWQGNTIRLINSSYIEFDADGLWDAMASGERFANWDEGAELGERVKRMKTPDIRTARKARDLKDTWLLSHEDFALILKDTINPVRRPIPILRLEPTSA